MLNRLMFGMALQDAPGEFEKFLRWTAQCEENDERRIAKIEEAMREDRREEKKKIIPMFTRGLLGISVLGFTRLLNC